MAGLQVLEEEFAAQGFHMLGFFSDDFEQGGTPGEIDACIDQYKVTFETFELAPVTAPQPQPVFSWLLGQPEPGPANGVAPTWNFDKYLISRSGQLVGHWRLNVDPPGPKATDPNFDTNPLVVAIRAELAKAP